MSESDLALAELKRVLKVVRWLRVDEEDQYEMAIWLNIMLLAVQGAIRVLEKR